MFVFEFSEYSFFAEEFILLMLDHLLRVSEANEVISSDRYMGRLVDIQTALKYLKKIGRN